MPAIPTSGNSPAGDGALCAAIGRHQSPTTTAISPRPRTFIAKVLDQARGLDPKNLHHLSQVFRSRPSARQRGVIKLVGLARRSLDGLRRSLARTANSLKVHSLRSFSRFDF